MGVGAGGVMGRSAAPLMDKVLGGGPQNRSVEEAAAAGRVPSFIWGTLNSWGGSVLDCPWESAWL